MSAEEVAGWVEIIKAAGAALAVVIGAIGLAYGRIAAKQAKLAVAQTATKQFIGGALTSKSSAVTAEQALEEAVKVRAQLEALLERERVRGGGARRADTGPQPDLRTQEVARTQQALPSDTAMFERLIPPGAQ